MNKYKDRVSLVEEYLDRVSLNKDIESFYKDKTILVTGGAGAIGSNLIIALSFLVGKKGKIIVLDNLSSIKVKDPSNIMPLENIMFVLDVTNDEDLKRVFKESPEMVFHLAAFFANQNSVDYPEKSAYVDVLGHAKLLEYSTIKISKICLCIKWLRNFRFISKDASPLDFISMHLTTPYQINKMTGEMYNNILPPSL